MAILQIKEKSKPQVSYVHFNFRNNFKNNNLKYMQHTFELKITTIALIWYIISKKLDYNEEV